MPSELQRVEPVRIVIPPRECENSLCDGPAHSDMVWWDGRVKLSINAVCGRCRFAFTGRALFFALDTAHRYLHAIGQAFDRELLRRRAAQQQQHMTFTFTTGQNTTAGYFNWR